MKTLKRMIWLAALVPAVLLGGCDKYDDGDIKKELNNLKDRIAALEATVGAMNGDVTSLWTIVNALDGRDYVTGMENLADGSGYKITFANAPAITVKHGTDGADGKDGADGVSAPVVGIAADEDGAYCWTLTSGGATEWLLDDSGEKMPVSGRDGQDGTDGEAGEPGEAGVTPRIGVDEEGFWTIDYGDGPEQVLDAAGDPISALGSGGDSFFKSVTYNQAKTGIVFTFKDGTSITLNRTTTPAAVTVTIDATGYQVFDYETSLDFTVTLSSNAGSVMITKPNGWKAVLNGMTLTVTAPAQANTYAEFDGRVTVLVISADGRSMASASIDGGLVYAYAGNAFLELLVNDPSKTNEQAGGGGAPVDLDPDNGSGRRGYITREDAAKVKRITVNSQSLTSLSGVEYFPNLEFLRCNDNSLTSLDVSGLANLQTLWCYNNSQMTTLDVSGCTSLQAVRCYDNNLSTLDVSNLTNLTSLSCYNNSRMTSLDVSGCTSLVTLFCNDNDLSALDVSGLANLQTLQCYNNSQMTVLNISGLTNLTNLLCDNNNLSGTLDVSNLTSLETLHCYNNNLSTLDVSSCTSLVTLHCYNNDLSTLDVSGCTNLETLHCYNTQIEELDVSASTVTIFLSCGNNGTPEQTVWVSSNAKLNRTAPGLKTIVIAWDGGTSFSDITTRDNLVNGVTVKNKVTP